MANNSLNNDGLEGAAKRMRHSREMQARVYEQLGEDRLKGAAKRMRLALALPFEGYDQKSPDNNAEVEALAQRMRHSRAVQAKAYEQFGAAESQP